MRIVYFMARLTNRFKTTLNNSLLMKTGKGKEFITFSAKFLAVNNNRFLKYFSGMFRLGNNFKITYSIIKSIAVYMVDYFKRKWTKWSAKMLLHYNSMSSNLFSVNRNKKVSVENLSSAFFTTRFCHMNNYTTRYQLCQGVV